MSAKFFNVRQGLNLGTKTSDPSDGVAGSFYFNSTTGKLRIYNGSVWKNVGSGTGFGDVDTMSVDTAEEAVLADYTQTGLEIVASTGLVHQDVAFRLIHQAASTRSFKKVIAVDSKFRGKNLTLTMDNRSTAQTANLTLLVRDETNSVDLLATTQIQTDSNGMSCTTTSGLQTLGAMTTSDYAAVRVGMSVTGPGIPTATVVQSKNDSTRVVTLSAAATASATVTLRFSGLVTKRSFSFDIPDNCLSMSWTISALQEANLPETYIDDVSLVLTQTAGTSTSFTVPRYITESPYTPTILNAGTITGSEITVSQYGEMQVIQGRFICGTPVSAPIQIPLANGALAAAGHTNYFTVGRASRSNTANATNDFVVLTQSGLGYVTLGVLNSSGNNATQPINADSIVANTDVVSFTCVVKVMNVATTESKTIPLTSAILQTQLDSYLELAVSNGYGSTATKIRRFSTLVNSLGSAITYADSAVNGGSFTVNEDGVYHLAHTDFTSTPSIGFTKNSANLTTSIFTLSQNTGNEVLAVTNIGASNSQNVAWTGKLLRGDVIRVHTDGNAGGDVDSCKFFMSKIGQTKQVNVSSDQKIEVPSHELRFEGSSSRGATDTDVIRFDSIAKMRGDGFSIVNTSANGTVITVLKAGVLSVSSTIHKPATNTAIAITKNQVALTGFGVLGSETLALQQSNNGTSETISATISNTLVAPGDVIRVIANATPSADAGNSLNLLLQEQKVQVALSNVTPQFTDNDTAIRVSTNNGFGSTATKIKRFSNVEQTTGSDVTFADSATLGSSFTINTSGIFTISYADNATSPSDMGISKNASSLTAQITSLSTAERLAMSTTSTAGYSECTTWSGYLLKGDVIRAQTDGNATSVAANASFSISKVAKPSFAAIDVTPFVNIPQTIERSYLATLTTNFQIVSVLRNSIEGEVTIDNNTGSTLRVLCNRDCSVFMSLNGYENSGGTVGTTAMTASLNGVTLPNYGLGVNNSASNASIPINLTMKAGDVFLWTAISGATGRHITVLTREQPTSLVVQNSTFTMGALMTQRVTGTPPTALGQYRSYLRNANATTYTETNGAPSIAPNGINGIPLYRGNLYTAADTNNNPTKWEIYIGKNVVFWGFSQYLSTGKTGKIIGTPLEAAGAWDSGYLQYYDPATGILTLEAFRFSGGAIAHYTGQSDIGGNVVSAATTYAEVTVATNPLVANVGQSRSMLRVSGGSGHGSGNTKIRRYTTIVENFGTAMTFTQSSVNGDSITINEDGVYALTAKEHTISSRVGFSRNSAQLTTNIDSITNADRLCVAESSGTDADLITAVTVFLAKGTVIRVHTNGNPAATVDSDVFMCVTQVSK